MDTMSRMSADKPSRRARRRFSDEFKESAVRLVLVEGKSIGAVARELDLTASALGYWVKHAHVERSHGRTGFVHDQLVTGRAFRVLTVIDQWSRESLLLEANAAVTGQSGSR